MMKKVLTMMVMVLTAISHAIDTVRYDSLAEGRPVVATGVEMRGALDGGEFAAWDTALEGDGWVTLTSGDASVDVLILNEPAVVGGRLMTNETWSADRIRVVRDDVVVPAGVTLTLAAGCIVKFLPGARFDVAEGGALIAEGAALADFADDFVGGDVNHDGEATVADGSAWWLDDSATAELVTVSFLDGANRAAPARSYTAGLAYGELPVLAKEGAVFDGWWTDPAAGIRISESMTVEDGETVLYAHWKTLAVSFGQSEITAAAYEADYSVPISAYGDWTISTDVPWIALGTKSGSNNATVTFIVRGNDTVEERVGTIRAILTSGLSCELTVRQSGIGTVASPVIIPADGTTFNGLEQRVTLTCAENGAQIRYTLDGGEPTEGSMLYSGRSFNVFDTTLIKARAFKAGMRPSAIVSARIIRLHSLAEAMDVPLWTVTTDDANPWLVDSGVSRSGGSSARSGRIGAEETTSIRTAVEGAGTLSFWWRASCEDDPDYDLWDYLAVCVDGVDVKHIDGDSGWQHVSLKIKGSGTHTIEWVYSKDYIDGDDVGEDCGWVDGVTWTSDHGDSGVPVSWLENLGAVSDSAASDGLLTEIANADPDGDGFTTAEEYVIGSDPNDASSTFTASIEVVDGKPVVTYAPELTGERKYTKWGKRSLSDERESWEEVREGEEANYKFFKVTVEMP